MNTLSHTSAGSTLLHTAALCKLAIQIILKPLPDDKTAKNFSRSGAKNPKNTPPDLDNTCAIAHQWVILPESGTG